MRSNVLKKLKVLKFFIKMHNFIISKIEIIMVVILLM